MCLRCGIGAVMGVVLKLLSFENFGNALEVDGVRWAGFEGVRDACGCDLHMESIGIAYSSIPYEDSDDSSA